MNKKILIAAGIIIITVILFVGCIQKPSPTKTAAVCGNGICESSENSFKCPVDCCVDGDGVCREGCTPDNDDDCEKVINKTKIFNWAETKRTADGGYDADVFSTSFGAHIYLEFNHTPPKPGDIISFYDSRQADDGSWGAGEYHWGPITGHTLMIYEYLNATPARSLDQFFEKIDTWEEVVDFTLAYHKSNPWGGIWGPIIAWYHYYGEDPPWWDDYDKAVKEYRDTWEADTHQSSHVLLVYYQLGKPLPEFTVNSILESQNLDGSWSPGIDETGFALTILTLYYNNVEPLDSIIEAAKKAEPYVWSCYHETADYAWFTQTPSTKEQALIKTWNGLFALKIINGLLYCGNSICEPNEDGFSCPVDCCVDGDGVCREGCTPVNDDDCEAKTIQDLVVGIHLENTNDFGDDADRYIKKAVDEIGCQLISRGWCGNQFNKHSWYSYWSSNPQTANEAGALFGAWQSVPRMSRGFGGQDDLITETEFKDYITRGADGQIYYTGNKNTYDSATNNEAYFDYLLAAAYIQIDAGANAIHYDEINSGEYFSPEGKVGYDDYAIGVANFCSPCSVTPSAIADSYSGNYAPSNAIDGDISTYWVSSGGPGPHWLEVDLSTNRTIRQISLSLDPERLLTSYKLQYYNGTNWINLITETNNSYDHPSYLVGSVSTTKIRIYTTQHPVAVAEFRVFGQGFRQYLIGKYGEDYDWEGEFKIDLTPGGSQCPDGTINYFNYREYLADNGWSGHDIWENNPRGSDPAYYPPFNPLFNEWGCSAAAYLLSGYCPSYRFWSGTKLGSCDPGIGKCAQSFVPSADEEIKNLYLYLKTDGISNDYTIGIQSDNNNSPSGGILGSVTLPSSLLENYSTKGRYARAKIPFDARPSVKKGKKYWIVISASHGIPNELLWQGSGDKVGATQELQGVWTPQAEGLFYEVFTYDDYTNESKTFLLQRNKRIRNYLFEHTRAYGAAKGKTVYAVANGIIPSNDYNDVGVWDLPTDDSDYLEGDQVWISRWRMRKAQAQHINDVPTMVFLDYGFTGFPFQDLATQTEREAYLRIYVPEMYASGLLFSYPVRMSWGYRAYNDWNEKHTSTTYDAIVNQSKFFNTYFSIYKDALIDPMEEDVKVKVGEEWITPSDSGKANEAKVSIALMDANDGDKIYLHVINHDWDSSAHRMREQTNIRFFVPLSGNMSVANINIISPDFLFKDTPVDWLRESDGVYLTIPSLSYYNVAVIEVNPSI